MATNEEIIARLPGLVEKLNETNKRAAEDAKVEDRIREKRAATREQELAEVAYKRALKLEETQELREIERARDDKKQREQLAAERAGSTAGQALELKATLESQGKIAEDSKEFQKLSFKARKEDRKERLKNPDLSPAAKKDIKEEAKADAKKNGSRLDKIVAGIGGLWAIGKKGLKTAALGGLAFLSTLAIGGLLIALGKFLQSDTFKELTKKIEELIPDIKKFARETKEYFFGERGLFTRLGEIYKTFKTEGFIAGMMCLWDNMSGLEKAIVGIAVAAPFLLLLGGPFLIKLAIAAAVIGGIITLIDWLADQQTTVAERIAANKKIAKAKADEVTRAYQDDEYGINANDYDKQRQDQVNAYLGGDGDAGGFNVGQVVGATTIPSMGPLVGNKGEMSDVQKSVAGGYKARAQMMIDAKMAKEALDAMRASNEIMSLGDDFGDDIQMGGMGIKEWTTAATKKVKESAEKMQRIVLDAVTLEPATITAMRKNVSAHQAAEAVKRLNKTPKQLERQYMMSGGDGDSDSDPVDYVEPLMKRLMFMEPSTALQKAAERIAATLEASAKAQLQRDADMASMFDAETPPSTNIVNAPTNNNIHNNGSMVGGSQSIVNPKYGSLNTEGV
jgi:hypothetical protein